MSLFKNWAARVAPLPIKNFLQRFNRKLRYLAKNIVDTIGLSMSLTGSKIVGTTTAGNTLLQLNKSYALGPKGTVLQLPRDSVIFEHVRKWGSWELDESLFLARGLSRVCRNTSKVALLDIGANTGLVTLQALNLSNVAVEVFLFEPIPQHTSAIKNNLRNLSNLHINEFALADKNGEDYIYTEATNYGNSSLLKSVVGEMGLLWAQIALVETSEYCNKFLRNYDGYVIKCDTQGMDALVLSRIPDWVWKNCESAIIEVWALDNVSTKDVETLLSLLQEFEHIAWQPNNWEEGISLSEVRDFWLSKQGAQRNLFLSRSI